MLPWESVAHAVAADGTPIELRRRGQEYLLLAGGRDLMSSADEASSRALASLALGSKAGAAAARVLIGGLGMGFTLREALDRCGPASRVEVAELVPEVVDYNRRFLGHLTAHPLDDPRVRLCVGDVLVHVAACENAFDAILLDVDNGPDALAHAENDRIYGATGIAAIARALRAGGVLGLWSFSDEPSFSRRLRDGGFRVELHRVPASRSGRGKFHFVWIAERLSANAAGRLHRLNPGRKRRR